MDEKWSPAIWIESLLASLVWVLESPNLDSPANVDAKKLYSRFLYFNLAYSKKMIRFVVFA
jgi:ubiquitin-protein ligase